MNAYGWGSLGCIVCMNTRKVLITNVFDRVLVAASFLSLIGVESEKHTVDQSDAACQDQ